jgi:hypothetical protein
VPWSASAEGTGLQFGDPSLTLRMTGRPRAGRALVLVMLFLLAPTLRADLLDTGWKAVPATGVEMKLSRDAGRRGNDAVRVDFDFRGHGGYAIARRDGAIELPENFELSFWMKADAPRNTLEVKFVDESGENVWWTTRPELEFPKDWRRFSIRKRQLEFAWGPAGKSPLPKRIGAIEIVVTAGTGGKGTVWIDDVQLAPLETAPPGPLPHVAGLPWTGTGAFTADLGARHEIGGLIIDWDDAPSRYDVALSVDGSEWSIVRRVESTNGGRDWIYLPDGDARRLRLSFDRGAIRGITLLEPLRTPNDFFTRLAQTSARGSYPRYLFGEQSYWTILGGRNGEQQEALLSEDGAIEAGDSRVSIEPFLLIDGELVTWNDVEIEQRTGPSVVWKKHLEITPRMEGETLAVRYTTAPNATLVLAIRPFQVNPPWQFLKRTGGTVPISRISRDGSTIVVDGDQRVAILADPASFGATVFDEGEIIEHLRKGTLPAAQSVEDPFGYASAAMRFDAHDVTIRIPLGPALPPVAASAWSIDVPSEPRIAESIRANVEYILINRDGSAIHPGSRSYERAWIRDGSLTSTAVLRLGHDDVVREFIEYYARYVAESGYVPCCVGPAGADPVPEHDSHGQFIYLVAEYYRHTGDRALIEKMWPTVARVAGYIDRLRQERMTAQYRETALWGLVPESISHEGYSAKAMHSYWDDLFILRGLKDATFLARETGRAEAQRYERLTSDFRRDLVASIGLAMKQHSIDYIPGAAELGDFDATSTTVAVAPVEEQAHLPRAALLATFERYWKTALEPRTYTPYEHRIVGTLVRLGQPERARTLLDYLFADQRPAAWHHWAEVVHRDPRAPAFIGDMPHTWVGSDFIRSALDLFAYEREADDALVIGAGVAKAWAAEGVEVSGISTHYGTLHYSMTPEGGSIRVRIREGMRVPSGGIVVVSPIDGSETVIRAVPADFLLTSESRGGGRTKKTSVSVTM